jgi:hypothetical protein
MFVFSARTRDIEPGDPQDPASTANPLLEIRIVDAGGTLLAHYRARIAFADAGGGLLEAVGLFVIIDGPPGGLGGQVLEAIGTLTDAAGAQRCGTRVFEVGP